MAKVSVRDAVLANMAAAIFLVVVATVCVASAVVKSNATIAPLPQSTAETLYKVGRYELLRDTAVNCERAFDQLVATAFRGQVKADWTAAVLALGAVAMLTFNVWFLRGVKHEIEALRSNSSMQPTGQERPAAD